MSAQLCSARVELAVIAALKLPDYAKGHTFQTFLNSGGIDLDTGLRSVRKTHRQKVPKLVFEFGLANWFRPLHRMRAHLSVQNGKTTASAISSFAQSGDLPVYAV